MTDLEGDRQREGIRDVKLGDELPEDQRCVLKDLVWRYPDVYCLPTCLHTMKKKDGSNRVCVDFRKLNKLTKVDPEPMTTAEDLFRRLSGKKYLSKIDLTIYWQIPVSPEDVHKTAFVTPDGQYEFTRMPFGMVNSGATLVRGLRKILEGMPGVGSYIDDIVIYSDSWEDHLQTLKELFGRLRKARITARPTKCLLGASRMEFLGHQVGGDVTTPSRDNLEKFINTPRPTSK